MNANKNAQTFWLENLQFANKYNNWIFQQIKPYLGNNVLEIGCGNGNFTVFLAQQCDCVTGIDIDREYVELAKNRLAGRSRITILQQDATEFESKNAFDTIVLLDVLEHIEDDVAILKKLNELLTPQGKLIIKVPALMSLYGEMDRVIGHYRRYDRILLLNTLNKANFDGEGCRLAVGISNHRVDEPSIWYFNLAGIPGWWLNSKVLKRTNPPSQQVSLFNKIVPVLSTLEDIIKPPIGLSLFAVASKNDLNRQDGK